ncbi:MULTISPECIES: PPOX class F420-dependent oxidoreductase [unclassified Streptomyces]|uniref:PPOX class F420-dependent oxidoreductase n=1 Tax=unclassified Streptomyces TaxID=2593676 RepID=UPI000B85E0E3|nr:MULTISPECIES: PPOX class F420-dependent oxidoreductase [unclassified Streptomyces]MYS20368.1 TIGR03618 family F420-dependent PPOX class oxidoreductase [Streptomyces sp. SID4948]
MEIMTATQWRTFVSTGTRTGKLGVQRKDGRPHVTPVWFVLDETDPDDVRVVINTGRESVKGRALRRDPHFALCVDDQEPPYSFVLLECTAELVEDLVELEAWATRIAARYMGEDRAAEIGARNAVPGEYLVRARIDKVTAHARLAE